METLGEAEMINDQVVGTRMGGGAGGNYWGEGC
jgi:hypothetical protein